MDWKTEAYSSVIAIQFSHCTFKKSFSFSNIEGSQNSIRFDRCNFERGEAIVFTNLVLTFLDFLYCYINKLSIKNSDIDSIIIENSNILKSLNLIKVKSGFAHIKNVKSESIIRLIRVNSPELDELEIDSAGQIESVKLFDFKKAEINSSIKEIKVYDGDFEQLFLGVTTFDESKRNSRIGDLSIIDINLKGTVRIEDVYISNFNLDRVDASQGTYFLNQTVLMDTSIVGCVFSKFYCNQLFFINNPEIINSDISTITINNLGWSNGKKLKGSDEFRSIPLFYKLRKKWLILNFKDFDTDDIVELRTHKDTYRQLKKASWANKNTIDALQFHANEMQTYWKEVRIIGGINTPDRILIFLNRWVSNFGQSWHMPLIWLFSVHFILLMSLYKWQFTLDLGNIEMGIGNFFYLMNPAHKSLDFISTGFGQFTEFFMRVFAGFFIFHFIKATRKFGRI